MVMTFTNSLKHADNTLKFMTFSQFSPYALCRYAPCGPSYLGARTPGFVDKISVDFVHIWACPNHQRRSQEMILSQCDNSGTPSSTKEYKDTTMNTERYCHRIGVTPSRKWAPTMFWPALSGGMGSWCMSHFPEYRLICFPRS